MMTNIVTHLSLQLMRSIFFIVTYLIQRFDFRAVTLVFVTFW